MYQSCRWSIDSGKNAKHNFTQDLEVLEEPWRIHEAAIVLPGSYRRVLQLLEAVCVCTFDGKVFTFGFLSLSSISKPCAVL